MAPRRRARAESSGREAVSGTKGLKAGLGRVEADMGCGVAPEVNFAMMRLEASVSAGGRQEIGW